MALGVRGTRVGCWTDAEHHTGCTVVLPPAGSQGVIAVRGGGPGTREAAALGPNGNVGECHAVMLSGGSAFGLATADGAVQWCAEHDIGYDTGVARVPIVGGAIVFDLRDATAPRPGAAAGRAACDAATEDAPPEGSVGVGAGCTVGKAAGLQWGSKGGQGWSVTSARGITVGALVAVNALGDVHDERGEVLAGSRAPADAPRFPMMTRAEVMEASAVHNTVIGCLVTNARLSKAHAVRVADLSHTGIARTVDPVHTTADGDALFLLSTQHVEADVDLVAHLGARAVAAAIRSAVRHADGMPGFPADPRAQAAV
jgi:L-aminopeptidase/D-esterase-like protein